MFQANHRTFDPMSEVRTRNGHRNACGRVERVVQALRSLCSYSKSTTTSERRLCGPQIHAQHETTRAKPLFISNLRGGMQGEWYRPRIGSGRSGRRARYSSARRQSAIPSFVRSLGRADLLRSSLSQVSPLILTGGPDESVLKPVRCALALTSPARCGNHASYAAPRDVRAPHSSDVPLA